MNFITSLSSVTSTQFSSTGRVDLNNYYTSYPGRQIIRCQICKLNILRIDVFEHTVSKRHKYNKLYAAISQNRCCNVDVDFVVLDIDRLQCRYCNSSLIIDSDRDDLIISHIQDCRHVQNKEARSNRFSFSSKGVSTVEQKSLQPLDSFITHDMKARKHLKKKSEKIQMKENLLETTGLMFKEQRVLSNVDRNIDQQYSLFSGDFKKQRGEELPKFIIIGEEATCRCTICMIEMPKTTYNVGGHIDGKKHRKKMLEESIRFIDQPTEILDTNKKLLPAESVLSKYCKIEETATDVRDTSNMVAKNVPDNSLFTKDFQRQRGEEVPKFVILGEGATCQCTICMIEMPQSIRNVGEHIDGTKHRKKMESIRFMDQRTEILDIKNKSPTESVLSKYCRIEGTVTDIRDTNYRVENNVSENSLFIEDFQRQRGEAVPKFIIFGEGGTCRCTICMKEMTKNIHNVGEHIDGKKHQKKIHKESTRFIDQRTEILDMKKKSPGESVLSKYCEIEEAVKDIRKTSNMVENNVSENSLFSKDFKRKRGEEVPKFIIIGEGATCKCTICMIEIPKTTYNVGGHIDGKKHRKNCAFTSTVRSTKILNTSENIDEHMNDEYERLAITEDIVKLMKAQTQKLESLALNKFLPTSSSNVKNGVYICTTCDVSVSNNERCIEQHNNGQKHINKMLQNF